MAQLAVAAVMLAAGWYKGNKANRLKENEAEGYRDAAGRKMAITTRELTEEIRNKELMHSRAIAVAGVQGGGTEGLTKLLGDLNAEGDYRIMSVLWNGMNEAEGLQYRAEAAEREGAAAQEAGWINGITSAVSSYSGMGGSFSLFDTNKDKIAKEYGSGSEKAAKLPTASGLNYSPVTPKKIWGN